jgi:hypothetical protein
MHEKEREQTNMHETGLIFSWPSIVWFNVEDGTAKGRKKNEG